MTIGIGLSGAFLHIIGVGIGIGIGIGVGKWKHTITRLNKNTLNVRFYRGTSVNDLLSAGDEDIVVVVGVGDGPRFAGAHHLGRGAADRFLRRDVPHYNATIHSLDRV